MRYSKLFGKTIKEAPRDEVSINAQLLIRAGFVTKEVSGVYNYLPLGLRVLNNITNIVRDEMYKAGGQEILLSALQNKASWEKTARWGSFDALYKVKSRYEIEYALGPTHEEVLVPLVKQFVTSYKDLPLSLYQIQVKFRDEARAKSGLLRGREFLMKDLYSFHTNEDDFKNYYKQMQQSYKKVFIRCGLDAIQTEASGGDFGDVSHEYQVLTESGEDVIFYCERGDFAQNKEIATVQAGYKCPNCQSVILQGKAIEAGNIFPLGTRFSDPFELTYRDENGKQNPVIMGCYGIGISRLMGTIVEIHHDDNGIIWPKEIAPYDAYLVAINKSADDIYEKLISAGIEVLFDDRSGVSAGVKFADYDLIGIPVRLVVSEKTRDKIEWKERGNNQTELISFDEVIKRLR